MAPKAARLPALSFNSRWWAWDSRWVVVVCWCGPQSCLMHGVDGRWARGGVGRADGSLLEKDHRDSQQLEELSFSLDKSQEWARPYLRGLTGGCRNAVMTWRLRVDLSPMLLVSGGGGRGNRCRLTNQERDPISLPNYIMLKRTNWRYISAGAILINMAVCSLKD